LQATALSLRPGSSSAALVCKSQPSSGADVAVVNTDRYSRHQRVAARHSPSRPATSAPGLRSHHCPLPHLRLTRCPHLHRG
jgi:hypothetical protein